METFEKGGCILASGTAKTSKDHVQGLARARRKMQLSFSARALLARDLLTPRGRATRAKAKLEHGQDPTAQGQSSGRHLAMDPQMADCRFVPEKHEQEFGILVACMPSASDLYHFFCKRLETMTGRKRGIDVGKCVSWSRERWPMLSLSYGILPSSMAFCKGSMLRSQSSLLAII